MVVLQSDLNLNIAEAHAFNTTDRFSLDVFVVNGWPQVCPLAPSRASVGSSSAVYFSIPQHAFFHCRSPSHLIYRWELALRGLKEILYVLPIGFVHVSVCSYRWQTNLSILYQYSSLKLPVAWVF